MPRLDLTHFGFTPTESLVYEVLLTGGPGTGYAIARSAGLARANAYSALEGLVTKGAARVETGRPKRYRPEAPAALIARISTDHGQALERLSSDLDSVSVPATPTLVEIESGRAVLQLVTHDVARATASVALLAPADAFPLLAPALRRPYSAGIPLCSARPAPVDLGFAVVEVVSRAGSPGPVCRSSAWSTTGARSSPRARAPTCAAIGAPHLPSSPARGSPSSASDAGHDRATRSTTPCWSCSASISRSSPTGWRSFATDIAAFRALRPEAAASLKTRFHRLAGSGGSYGFPEISVVAREMEQWMATKPAPGEAPRLDEAVDRLATLFRQAQASMGTPARPAGTPAPRHHHPAAVGERGAAVAAAIEAEGYDVRLGHRREDPAETPPGERPDLLVIGTAAGEGDPSAVASRWTGARDRVPAPSC